VIQPPLSYPVITGVPCWSSEHGAPASIRFSTNVSIAPRSAFVLSGLKNPLQVITMPKCQQREKPVEFQQYGPLGHSSGGCHEERVSRAP